MDIRTKIGSSNFIKAVDLQGQPIRVTIRQCVEEMVGQGRQAEEKAVLYFQGRDKGLVLNSTNANAIGDAFGFETDVWIGKDIELFPSTTDFQGKIVDCLRVRIPTAVVATAAAASPIAAAAGQPANNSVPF